jgi:hypothetical protein
VADKFERNSTCLWLERTFHEYIYAKFYHSPGLQGLVVLVSHRTYLS